MPSRRNFFSGLFKPANPDAREKESIVNHNAESPADTPVSRRDFNKAIAAVAATITSLPDIPLAQADSRSTEEAYLANLLAGRFIELENLFSLCTSLLIDKAAEIGANPVKALARIKNLQEFLKSGHTGLAMAKLSSTKIEQLIKDAPSRSKQIFNMLSQEDPSVLNAAEQAHAAIVKAVESEIQRRAADKSSEEKTASRERSLVLSTRAVKVVRQKKILSALILPCPVLQATRTRWLTWRNCAPICETSTPMPIFPKNHRTKNDWLF